MKLKFVLLIILSLMMNKSFCQEQSFTKETRKFIIEERRLTSQIFADAFNGKNDSLPIRQWTSVETGKTDSLLPSPPPPLPIAASDFKRFKYFTVKPDYYIEYNISNQCDTTHLVYGSNRIRFSQPQKIKKINRNDLSVESFDIANFKINKDNLPKTELCDYVVEKEDKSSKRVISGYNCYKITLKNSNKPNYVTELFVTKSIRLNYHPIINCEQFLSDYYPLYIKTYHVDYPNEKFIEYTFIRGM